MKPPICGSCGKRFSLDDGGGLVTFANYEPLPDGMTGHPKGKVWFCKRHLNRAQLLKDKSSGDALIELHVKYRIAHWIRRLFGG